MNPDGESDIMVKAVERPPRRLPSVCRVGFS